MLLCSEEVTGQISKYCFAFTCSYKNWRSERTPQIWFRNI